MSIFLSVDPLAEKFVGWNPYHYVHNNPINLIDPTGMSAEGIIVSNTTKKSFVNNQALNAFVSTEEGKSFLSDYAKKGDVVGDHTFNSDGKYHNKGIDIVFNSEKKDSATRGWISSSMNGNRAEFTFSINSNLRVESQDGNIYDTGYLGSQNVGNIEKAIISKIMTIIHETFLHGQHKTKDFLNDNIFNNSNIDIRIANNYKDHVKHMGHAQVQFGSDASSSLFNSKGLKAIESANLKFSFGKHYE